MSTTLKKLRKLCFLKKLLKSGFSLIMILVLLFSQLLFSQFGIIHPIYASSTISTSTSATATGYSFQRKTWYDGTRYWSAFHNDTDNRIEFWYSTDGSSWTENTNARLSIDTNDFTIEADSSDLFIAYTNGFDIESREDDGNHPGTTWAWGSATVVYNGSSSTDAYSYPSMTKDSNNKLWITAKHYTQTTTNYYAGVGDGNVLLETADTWTNVREATNGNVVSDFGTTGYPGSDSNGVNWAVVSRMFLPIDTSALPDNATISAATLYTYSFSSGNNGDNDGIDYVAVVQTFQASNTALDTADYEDCGSDDPQQGGRAKYTPVEGSDTHHDITTLLSTTAYVTWPLNATGLGWISKTGYTKLGIREGHDIEDNEPSGFNRVRFYMSERTGTSQDPYLAVTYDEYFIKAIQSSSANDISSWASSSTLNQGGNSNTYGVIVPLGSGDMYSAFIDNAAIKGCLYDEQTDNRWEDSSGNDCTDGANQDAIATGVTGLTNTLSAVSDSSAYVHLIYIDSSNNVLYQEYTTSWQTAVTLDSNAGNEYPTISLDTASSNDLYAFWIRNNDIFFKKGVSPYGSGNWDASIGTIESSGTNDYLTSNYTDYSSGQKAFLLWQDGAGSPYDINFVFFDNTAPSISLTALSPDPNSDTTPDVTGTATEAIGTVSTVEYQMDGTGGSWTACVADDGTFDEASEAFTCTPGSALSDGAHTMYVRATDSNGNTTAGGSESSDAFTIDGTIPTVSLTAYTPDPDTDTTPTLTGTATDATTVLTAIEYQMDGTGGSWTTCTADDGTIDETSETFSCTVGAASALSDGSHTMYVRATDNASNNSANAEDSFTIDVTSPNEFTLESPGDGSFINTDRPTFKWKPASTTDATSGLSHYRLDIDNGDEGSFSIDNIPVSRTEDYNQDNYTVKYINFNDSDNTNNYIELTTKSNKSDSSWNNNQNDGKLREGKRTWRVKAVDNTSNERQLSRSLYVDRTAPSISFSINDTSSSTSLNNTTTGEEGTDGEGTNDEGILLTTNTSLGLSGTITDIKKGSNKNNNYNDKIRSDPKEVTITITKIGLLFDTLLSTINITDLTDYTDKCSSGKNPDSSSSSSSSPDDVCTASFNYTISGLEQDNKYSIKVEAKDKAGNSSSSTKTLKVTSPTLYSYQLEQVVEEELEEIIEEKEKEGIILTPEERERLKKELMDKQKQLEILVVEPSQPFILFKIAKDITGKVLGVYFNTVEAITSLAFNIFNNVINILKNTSNNILLTFNNIFNNTFNRLNNIIKTKYNNTLSNINYSLSTISEAIAFNYNKIAFKAPKHINKTMINISLITLNINKSLKIFSNNTLNLANNIINTANNIKNYINDVIYNGFNSFTKPVIDVGLRIVKSFNMGTKTFMAYLFDKNPTKIMNIKLTEVKTDKASLSFDTNHPSTVKVNYGESTAYGMEKFLDKPDTEHTLVLDGLEPGKEYYYEIIANGKNIAVDAYRTFKTPGLDDKEEVEEEEDKETLDKTLTINLSETEVVNIREYPSKESQVIAKLKGGTKVKFGTIINQWINIFLKDDNGNDINGWVWGELTEERN